MSSPVGHAAAGLMIALWRQKSLKPVESKLFIFYVFVANVPDLDFLPGLILGKPNYYHHGVSHSIGAAILFGTFLAFFVKKMTGKKFGIEFLYLFSIYVSHLMLDLISYDGRPPLGIPVLWPFSGRYFMIRLLPPVNHSQLDNASISQFLTDLFSMHNLYVVSLEILVTIPFLIILIWHLRKSRKI